MKHLYCISICKVGPSKSIAIGLGWQLARSIWQGLVPIGLHQRGWPGIPENQGQGMRC